MSLSPANAERLKQVFQQCRDMEGTLSEQLEAYAAAGREFFPAYGEAVDRLVARIHENGGGETAPRPGEAMPPFLLPDETGRLVSLASLLTNGPVAVMFYRGHWCPYCRLNVRAVIQAQDRIKALGAQRLGAADPRDLRSRPRRAGEGPLRRSRFPQAHGDRRPDRRAAQRKRRALVPDELLPICATQHAHHGGRHGRSLTPGDAVKMHGAARIEPFDRGAF